MEGGYVMAAWIDPVKQELTRLEQQLGPIADAADPMDWHRRRAGQAKGMSAFVEKLGGRLWQKPNGDWALRIDGRTSSSTAGWCAAVTNAIAAAEKAA